MDKTRSREMPSRGDHDLAILAAAQELIGQKRAREARAILEQRLRTGPDGARLRYALGLACQFADAAPEAILAYRCCIQLDPEMTEAHNNLGTLLMAGRHYDEAIGHLRTALRLQPNYVRALTNLGRALHESGKSAEAMTTLADAVCRFPRHAPALIIYATVLADGARHADALLALQRALELEPQAVEPHYLLGRTRLLTGDAEGAVGPLEEALRLQPAYRDARLLLAEALSRAGRVRDAVRMLREAEAADGDDPEVACALAEKEYAAGELDAALTSFGRVLEREPTSARAWRGRGYVLEMMRNYAAAVASYQRALELQPNDGLALVAALICDQWTCDWSSAELRCEVLRGLEGGIEAINPWILLGLTDDPAEHLRVARARADSVNQGIEPLPVRKCHRHDRLKVAYLSSDFCHHATAQLITEIIELHDRKRFEVYGVSFSPDDATAASARIGRAFDELVDVRAWSDRAIAQWIRVHEIDVLVDLKGYTNGARTRILGYRAAPVQVNFLGFPGTMGNSAVDYIVADERVVTAASRPHIAEAVAFLPDCYQPNDRRRERPLSGASRAGVDLPNDCFVFCCFNNNWKIGRDIFAAWMKILAAVDGSILWLLGDNADAVANLRAAALAAGIASERLVFCRRATYLEHLARYAQADLFLDTLPCNAHTTCSEALWMGLPVLTCAGRGFAARVGASLLAAAELDQLVTGTLEEYVSLAIGLARDRERLMTIRTALYERVTTTRLFDSPRFCRNLETAYLQMHELAARGEQPRDLRIR
jgi:protein O-GlcNAc transferase